MEKSEIIHIIFEYKQYIIKREVIKQLDIDMKFLYDNNGDYIPLKYMKEIIDDLENKNLIKELEGDALKYINLDIYHKRLKQYRCRLMLSKKFNDTIVMKDLYLYTMNKYNYCKLLAPELELPIPEFYI